MNGKAEIVINTKVSEWSHKRLTSICAKTGITIYNFLQIMLDTIIRYMSKDTNVSPAMERAITIFEDMDDWRNQFNLCDASDLEVTEALYFVGKAKKSGTRAIMVKRPYFGQWTQTVNLQTIFESIINQMFPSRYRKLRLLAVEWGCSSQLDVLDRLLDNELQGIDTDEIRKEFEDCYRNDYGQKPSDHRYKRKHHKTVDGMEAKQQTIHFEAEDLPPMREIQDTEDSQDIDAKIGRPFGYEG